MSARILKAAAGQIEFAPFAIPLMGDAAATHPSGVTSFVLPTVDQIALPTEQADNSPFEIIETDPQAARDEASRIIAQAERDREMIKQAAYEQGIAEARASAEAETTERIAAELANLREAFAASIEKVSGLSGEIIARAEHDLVELALSIAKKIVLRETSIDREIVVDLVRVSLGKLHNRSSAEVRLNPVDLAYIADKRQHLGFRGSLELTEDASITPGGCLVHTSTGDIDARIESQFDEIAEGLLKIAPNADRS